jgi:hypothetical protein
MEMVIGLYGNYFLLLKDFINEQKGKKLQLKTFLEQKPNLTQGIMAKLENVCQRLVEKGLTKHSIVQAIMNDYVQNQPDKEKLKQLGDLIKEKLPALLASRQGLQVACAIFTILDAKDRKAAIKAIPVVEMLSNKLAHLFLIHIANTLDDTQLTKKKLLHEALKVVDDLIGDKCYQTFIISSLLPQAKDQQVRNTALTPEDMDMFATLAPLTSSKKDNAVRANELFKIAQKPLEMFFEEKL